MFLPILPLLSEKNSNKSAVTYIFLALLRPRSVSTTLHAVHPGGRLSVTGDVTVLFLVPLSLAALQYRTNSKQH